MTRFKNGLVATIAFASICLYCVESANAHFLWLKSESKDGKPQAVLFFGESAQDEAHHFPDKLDGTKVWRRTADGKRSEVATTKVDNDDRVAYVGPLENDEPCVLETSVKYGLYSNWLLTYYTKHILASANDQLAAAGPSSELKLDIVPRASEEELELVALWEGKPKADVKMTVTVGDGDASELKTDAEGKASLKPKGEGLAAIVANFVDETSKGDFNGKPYAAVASYATLTLPWKCPCSEDAGPPAETKKSEKPESSAQYEKAPAPAAQFVLPPLPEPVSSFGAAVADGWLYVYSGHTGAEHDHSAANQSTHFRRVLIDGGREWEELPMQTPLQGLALVSYQGKLYRVGGMNARNATTKDKEDLHSTDEFACYDPATRQWTVLAPLPAQRSSHNAVVIGHTLYVVGGWKLDGPRTGEWLDRSVAFDLDNPSAGWQKLPEQSFQRRALAAGESHGKLAAIGGMDQDLVISQHVDIFDPQTQQWSQAADLPGADMAGFGVAACSVDGKLYVCGNEGSVYRLSEDGSKWDEVARVGTPRFFHQLLPASASDLLMIGGATMKGHLADSELIRLAR
jgi:N-acetylneuraminic acid mutarotase